MSEPDRAKKPRYLRVLILGALLAGVFWAVQGPPGSDGDRPRIVVSEVEVAAGSLAYLE